MNWKRLQTILTTLLIDATIVSKNVNQGESTVPINEDVTFWCSSSTSHELSQIVLDDPEVHAKLDFTKRTMFLIHGWIDSPSTDRMQNLARDVLQYTDSNVCVVGWERLAHYPYPQAALNHTLLVSGYFAKFIQFLNQAGVPLENVVLVGHSMGAHICGQTGHKLNGQVAEIYGLDPSGYLFTYPEERGLEYRLDKTDARFVQMIITTRFARMLFGDGHQNFYPNGGSSPQIDCVNHKEDLSTVTYCSHVYAETLFRLALNPDHPYLGRKCSSFNQFLLNMCYPEQLSRLGIYSNKISGEYFLYT